MARYLAYFCGPALFAKWMKRVKQNPAFGSVLVWISLCSLCVLCVSVVLASCIPITTETQRTQRLYREE